MIQEIGSAMNKPFDPTKPVRTRGGQPARILCTDAKGNCGSIVALVLGSNFYGAYENTIMYYSDGRYGTPGSDDNPIDLVNVPERTSLFRNVWAHSQRGSVYRSLEEARNSQKDNKALRRICVLEYVYEEDAIVDVIVHPAKEEK